MSSYNSFFFAVLAMVGTSSSFVIPSFDTRAQYLTSNYFEGDASSTTIAPTPAAAISWRRTRLNSIVDDDEKAALFSTGDDGGKKSKVDAELRSKLVSESIAPWRTLRLFLYASFGSGAFVGGLITLTGLAAALNKGGEVDMNTEYLNLAIDFGFAVLFAVLAKFDLDKGQELNEKVDKKLASKKTQQNMLKQMKKREAELFKLPLSIQISPTDTTKRTTATIQAIQEGAKQHIILVAGPRKAIKDALLGANLLKLDFAMSNILVVPYTLNESGGGGGKSKKGFGERPVWETQPYVAEVVADGSEEANRWDDYIQAELKDAVQQNKDSTLNVLEEGVAVVLANNGKVLRRGVGQVPWRQMVEELQAFVAPEEKEEEPDIFL